MTSIWYQVSNPRHDEDTYYLSPQYSQHVDQFRLYIRYTPTKLKQIQYVDLFHGLFGTKVAQLNYSNKPAPLSKLPDIFTEINKIIITHLI